MLFSILGLCNCECHQEVTLPNNEISNPATKEKATAEKDKEPVESGILSVCENCCTILIIESSTCFQWSKSMKGNIQTN